MAVAQYNRSSRDVTTIENSQKLSVQFRDIGRTVKAKGSFQSSNNIIANAQSFSKGRLKLCRYIHFRGLLFIHALYFGLTTVGSFLHVGAASGTVLIDVLWILLFCQYVYVACKVVPLMLKHPSTKYLDRLNKYNMLVEIKVEKEGRYEAYRYIQLSEHFRAAELGGGNLDLRAEFNAAMATGIYFVHGGIMQIQIISKSMKCHLRKTQCNTFFLIILQVLHLIYAMGCLVAIPVLSDGKPYMAFIFDSN